VTARVRTAVIPVAGLGTRFLPVTKAVPKEMLPIVDRPCIEYVVAEAVAAGLDEIVFVTARGKDAIADYFDRAPELEARLAAGNQAALLAEVQRVAKMAEVISVRQPEALGLGHAVLCAKAAVGDRPFAVFLGDDIIASERPAIADLLDARQRDDEAVVCLLEVPLEHTRRYGICAGTWDGKRMAVSHMVEKPAPEDAPSRFAIVGRYVLPPDIFQVLESIPRGAGGEYQLTDALAVLASRNRCVGVAMAGDRFDTGTVLGLLRASIHFTLARPELADGMRALLREYADR
jgi:UTP--glucose-1-phosphate uridylyltransferase